jgi:hypothetical protein
VTFMNIETQYHEADLETVLRYFGESFRFKGKSLIHFDTYCDPVKAKVIYKFALEDAPRKRVITPENS